MDAYVKYINDMVAHGYGFEQIRGQLVGQKLPQAALEQLLQYTQNAIAAAPKPQAAQAPAPTWTAPKLQEVYGEYVKLLKSRGLADADIAKDLRARGVDRALIAELLPAHTPPAAKRHASPQDAPFHEVMTPEEPDTQPQAVLPRMQPSPEPAIPKPVPEPAPKPEPAPQNPEPAMSDPGQIRAEDITVPAFADPEPEKPEPQPASPVLAAPEPAAEQEPEDTGPELEPTKSKVVIQPISPEPAFPGLANHVPEPAAEETHMTAQNDAAAGHLETVADHLNEVAARLEDIEVQENEGQQPYVQPLVPPSPLSDPTERLIQASDHLSQVADKLQTTEYGLIAAKQPPGNRADAPLPSAVPHFADSPDTIKSFNFADVIDKAKNFIITFIQKFKKPKPIADKPKPVPEKLSRTPKY